MATTGRVRRAGPRDLDRLAALWVGIASHHEALDPAFRLRPEADSEIRRLLEGALRDPDAAVLVYDQGGDLPGLCIVRIDRAPAILDEVERAEITDLGVREEMRRRGVGRALADAALDWVRERGVARAEVRVASANPEAQGFWRALGFGDWMHLLHRHL
ncbi:MAG: GNAT family N-acetyltransferase [Proteobacteria bacterium]|nr:GNAT family N-acetyltransferase [Pseudomonadota bacterium]MCZ6785420.1 GNAT family N-acetyltransferase [Pseudomonadota bacterium]